MRYHNLLFCLALVGTFWGTFGFDSFQSMKYAEKFKITNPGLQEQSKKQDTVLKGAVESMKEKQGNLSKTVEDLVSILEKNKVTDNAAIQAQNKIMKALTNKDKRLESLIKNMKSATTAMVKSGFEVMNTSVSGLLQRVTKLEAGGGSQNTVVEEKLKSMSAHQQRLSTVVQNLASSVSKTEKRIEAAMQAREKSMQDLTRNYEHLISVIIDMKKMMPAVDIKNLALRKPTQSSSVRDFWHVDGPVDGSLSRVGWSGSCFASGDFDEMPWWQVDLEATYVINEVKVTARGDCCSSKLRQFTVQVFQENPVVTRDTKPKVCYETGYQKPKRGETIARKCTKPLPGRYVRIQGRTEKDGENTLQFCEVQVFGQPENE